MLLYMVHSLLRLQTQFAVDTSTSCSGAVHAVLHGPQYKTAAHPMYYTVYHILL